MMVVVEWYSEVAGYDCCIANSMQTAHMIASAIEISYPNLAVRIYRVGDGSSAV